MKKLDKDNVIAGVMWLGVVAMMVGCANNRIESNHPNHSLEYYMNDGPTVEEYIPTTAATTEYTTEACENATEWTLDTTGYEIYTKEVTSVYEASITQPIIELTEVATEPVTTVTETVPPTQSPYVINLTPYEQELMVKVASCEAGGQGIKGMALVLMTVINRSRLYGASITDVIYAPNQYVCVGNYLWENGYVVPEAYEALAQVMLGWDESLGATYFCTPHASSWHDSVLTFLFQYGDHKFYK